MREQSIVGNYYRLAPKKRLDVIVLHYDGFPAMMKDYENELQDWILISRVSVSITISRTLTFTKKAIVSLLSRKKCFTKPRRSKKKERQS